MAFNPRTYFDANPYTVSDFLVRQKYKVPENQRNYSWGSDEFERLWDDIILVIGENTENDGKTLKKDDQIRPFFFGAIVLEKTNDLFPAQIIDGQQRLTTLTILLSSLFEFANSISDVGLRTTLTGAIYPLVATNSGGSGRVARLQIGRDNVFFDDFVIQNLRKEDRDNVFFSLHETKKTVVVQKIYDCYQLFYDKINDFVGPASSAEFSKRVFLLFRVILNFITILELEVKDESVAYRVFETLNERGLDLTQADLIKNEIIRIADSGGYKESSVSKWNELETNLSENPDEVNNFFRMFYISKYGLIKAQDTFDKIRALINPSSVIAFVNSACIESELYSKLINTSSDFSSGANDALSSLHLLKITYAYPVLLSACVAFSPDDFEKSVRSIRDFCFRYLTVGGGSPDGLAKILAPVSAKIRDRNYTCIDLMTGLKKEAPDSVFEQNFKGFVSKNSKIAFYTLKSIEDFIAGGQGVEVLGQSYTQHLEHIMPKKPTSKDWVHTITDERYSMYLNRIGNLLVLEKDINSHIKNKGFTYKDSNEKTKDYQTSVLKLPSTCRNFLDKDSLWSLESINNRQEDLAIRYATKTWPIEY